MYQILLVDDEHHAIQGIQASVNWQRLQIGHVHVAYNIRQAKSILTDRQVDLLVCDIEMPEGSGIELLQWMRDNEYDRAFIFLTCHSDFQFAQQALQLGSLDYLLKPVRYIELEQVIAKALDKVEQQRRQEQFTQKFDQYYTLWKKHEPVLLEQLWQDLLNRKMTADPQELGRILAQRDIVLTDTLRFRPILIQVQNWHRHLSMRDIKFLEYGLTNAAAHSFVIGNHVPQVVRLGDHLWAALSIEQDQPVDASSYRQKCQDYIDFCHGFLYCDIRCFVGEAVSVLHLADEAGSLRRLAYRSLPANQVFFLADYPDQDEDALMVIDKVRRYILDNISQPLQRKDIAEVVYLNPDYLAKFFRKKTGVSLTEYIQDERMRLAREMLEMTGESIGAIAAAVGYSSFSYFSKVFKNVYGMTPQEFRERMPG